MDLLVATHSVPLEQADKVSTEGIAQYATDGNPAQNIPATVFTAGQYNSIMSEVVNAIKAGGLTPERNEWNQLATIIKKFKSITDLFDEAIDLKTINSSNDETTITADFNTGSNMFYGWSSFLSSVEINREDASSQNCLLFSYGEENKRSPTFYIAADEKELTIASANPDDLSKSEILMSINKETKEFFINGSLKPSGADLAEYYHADRNDYKPGTVMMFGGENEITLCTDPAFVFGVISTNPALIMNNSTSQKDQYYPIALVGQTPVRVIGKVKKNDRLTVTVNGMAQKATNLSDCVIGRALEDKQSEGEGLVKCFVKAVV